METRIVVPILDEGGLDAPLSQHFGRAPYFIIVEIDEEGKVLTQRTVPNRSGHFGGEGTPAEHILQLKPNVVVTYGMGPKALNFFQNARVAVLRTRANTVKEVINAYKNDKLEELTEGCHQAHHQ